MKITVYSGNACVNCEALKDFLENRNIEFEEKNVSIDREAKKELMDIGLLGVPVIILEDDEEKILHQGFHREWCQTNIVDKLGGN